MTIHVLLRTVATAIQFYLAFDPYLRTYKELCPCNAYRPLLLPLVAIEEIGTLSSF
jgi:hypothetical protein